MNRSGCFVDDTFLPLNKNKALCGERVSENNQRSARCAPVALGFESEPCWEHAGAAGPRGGQGGLLGALRRRGAVGGGARGLLGALDGFGGRGGLAGGGALTRSGRPAVSSFIRSFITQQFIPYKEKKENVGILVRCAVMIFHP